MRAKPEYLTVGLLKELIGNRNIPELQKLINGHDDSDYLDLINRDDYIASKLWSKQDIINQMNEMGIEVTEDNVADVINSGLLKGLNECSDQDWGIISDAINVIINKEEKDL